MSRVTIARESARTIEGTVGAKRHQSMHIARAISAERRVYVLHLVSCIQRRHDLRECNYSLALAQGIDATAWEGFEDRPIVVTIDRSHLDLRPDPALNQFKK